MAILAIKGHATRSKEVIEILEMLGGTNSESCWGVFDNRLYSINAFDVIEDKSLRDNSNYQVYTLEEFLEKFPYKVGDKVLVKPYIGARQICEMKWDSDDNCIKYGIGVGEWFKALHLQPYKEETMEERENSVVVNIEHKQLKVNSLRFDKTQLVISDEYELKQERDAYYIVRKKLQYPKTYEECCDVLGVNPSFDIKMIEEEESALYFHFIDLLRCRNAYRKIAGEQMGLGKPWEPNWRNSDEDKYCVEYSYGRINHIVTTNIYNYILAFPTAEMREAFYESFKDLIEECKELL